RPVLICLAVVGCRPRQPPAASGPTLYACEAAGCPAEPGLAHEGGELVVHVEAEPAVLCDLIEHDVWSRWRVEHQVAETLFFQDPWPGQVTGRLAERFEVSAEALTLHLRQGVKWHDGAPFSAEDVVFTLERARDPAVGADQKADLDP